MISMMAFMSRSLAVALLLSLAAAMEARAQSSATTPSAMQGFAQNRDQPVRIEAASLEMRDKKKEATFSGDVKVVQGDTTMTSKTLVVFYDQSEAAAPAASSAKASSTKAGKSASMSSATPGPGGSSSIRRLEAKGSVVVVQKDQVVTGETAIFDPRANLITMTGGSSGVVLTQCQNVMKGDRLKVDMTTGVSRVEANDKVVVMMNQSSQGCASAPGVAPAVQKTASPLSIPGKK